MYIPLRNTVKKSLRARRLAGKPVLSQFAEMVSLFASKSRLKPAEYFAFGLYDDRIFSRKAKAEFVGTGARETIYAVNDGHWRAIGDDKIIFYAVMRGLGIRTPEIYGVYSPSPRAFAGVPNLTNPNAVAGFLLNGTPYPFFAKPILGSYGKGTFAIQSCDRDKETLTTRAGEQLPVNEFVTRLSRIDKGGYIFQRCLQPHPTLKEICGQSLSTARVVIRLSDAGPRLLRAVWRIPRGSNVHDNFAHGRAGNLLGRLDLQTGKVLEVVGGIGFDRATIANHPDTGKPIAGTQLPDWQAAVDLCLHAAYALPGIRLQPWDVGFTSDGPMIIEINPRGDFDIIQHADRIGFRRGI
jgi:glutathione synthase/RimK-type ligase-like ATP-grasp enzyme